MLNICKITKLISLFIVISGAIESPFFNKFLTTPILLKALVFKGFK